MRTIKVDTIYIEDKEGYLVPSKIKKTKIILETENQGHLMDGRSVHVTYSGGNEKWYIPYKYQKGER
jgi:hypothetical protein